MNAKNILIKGALMVVFTTGAYVGERIVDKTVRAYIKRKQNKSSDKE